MRLLVGAAIFLAGCGASCPPERRVPNCQTVYRYEVGAVQVRLSSNAAGYRVSDVGPLGAPVRPRDLSTTPAAVSAQFEVEGPGGVFRAITIGQGILCHRRASDPSGPGSCTIDGLRQDFGHNGGPMRAEIPLADGVALVLEASVDIAVSECHGVDRRVRCRAESAS